MNEISSRRSASRRMARSPFFAMTVVVSAVAALVTFATIALGLPAWAMFLGWVAYGTSAETMHEGASSTLSFLLGLALGIGNGLAIGLLTPSLGIAAAPLVVFCDVVIVLSLRSLAPINNPLAWFLGMICFFASAQAPSTSLFALLAAAGMIGSVGAGISSFLESRCERLG